MQGIAVFFLATVAMGGVVWVFVYPILSGERQTEKRMASVAKAEPVARVARGTKSRGANRSKPSSRNSKSATSRASAHRCPCASRRPAFRGRNTNSSLSRPVSASSCSCWGCSRVAAFIVALALGFVGVLGLPRWMLSFLKKRRENKFLNAFPDAVDIIVRGVKAGLPLLDCLKMITAESPEPVKSEFRAIVETQAIGMPLGDACDKLYEHMPVPEANFFGIVVAIQQRSGGNLAEALGNLSRVLRDRKKMKAKIRAMSQEAKASAGIIGALPIAVMTLVWLTSPQYISLLWTEPFGRLMLAASAVWMSMGVLVMKKMINFDF